MCKYSLEAYKVREAKQGETLVANMHSGRAHGVLTEAGTRFDGKLVCVLDGQKLTFENFQLSDEVVTRWLRESKNGEMARELVGQHVTAELVDGRNMCSGMDTLRFRVRRKIVEVPLAFVKPGTEVYIGVKAKPKTLEQKLELDAVSLRRVAVDMAMHDDPKDKPDNDEEPESKEPEEEKEPEKIVAAARRALAQYREAAEDTIFRPLHRTGPLRWR